MRTSTRRTTAAKRRSDVASVDEGTTRYFASLLKLELDEEGLGSRKAAIAESLRQRGARPGKTDGRGGLLMQIPSSTTSGSSGSSGGWCSGYAAISALGARLTVDPAPGVAGPLAGPLPLAGPPDDDPPVVHGRRGAIARSSGRIPRPASCRSRTSWHITRSSSASGRSISGSTTTPVASASAGGSRFRSHSSSFSRWGWRSWRGGPDLWASGPAPLPRRVLSVFLPAAYPWLMTFGLMGLFRRFCPVESPTMRYLSDSAYWLYLAHLPLIIAAQYVVRDWPLPALAKFLLIVVVVTSFLLWTYETLVRYTWLGRFLNGRARPPRARLVCPPSSREAGPCYGMTMTSRREKCPDWLIVAPRGGAGLRPGLPPPRISPAPPRPSRAEGASSTQVFPKAAIQAAWLIRRRDTAPITAMIPRPPRMTLEGSGTAVPVISGFRYTPLAFS